MAKKYGENCRICLGVIFIESDNAGQGFHLRLTTHYKRQLNAHLFIYKNYFDVYLEMQWTTKLWGQKRMLMLIYIYKSHAIIWKSIIVEHMSTFLFLSHGRWWLVHVLGNLKSDRIKELYIYIEQPKKCIYIWNLKKHAFILFFCSFSNNSTIPYFPTCNYTLPKSKGIFANDNGDNKCHLCFIFSFLS